MLRLSIIFLVLAIISAILGFGDALFPGAVGIAVVAKVSFFIFLALFVLTILFGATLFKDKD